MAGETKIEWCHHTWNPVRGCTKISAGCGNCYAEEMAKRNPAVLGVWGPTGRRAMTPFDAELWRMPERWNRAAKAAGEVRRVFVNSMWDPGEGRAGQVRDDYLPVLERMRTTFAGLDYLRVIVLTKRPEHVAWWARAYGWPDTWWAGVSVENQAAYDERVGHLLEIDAAVRLLSMEPLLGPVEIEAADLDTGLDWVIVGGESGRQARHCWTDWFLGIVDQCTDAGVPVFVKQLGSHWARANGKKDPKGGDPDEWIPVLRRREVPHVR